MNLRRRFLALALGMLLVLTALGSTEEQAPAPAGTTSGASYDASTGGHELIAKKSSKKKSSKKKSSKRRGKKRSRRSTPAVHTGGQASTRAIPAPPPPPLPPVAYFPEQLSVPANDRNGRATTAMVHAGRTYRVLASGDFRWEAIRSTGTYRPWADAECASPGARPFFPHLFNPADPSDDPLDLYINGLAIDWRPIRPDSLGCSPEHLYEYFFVPNYTGTVHFVIKDAEDYADNIGALTVTITD